MIFSFFHQLSSLSITKLLQIHSVVEPRRVRIFRGHTGRITDMCMTPDGRWLISSSTDSTVRVWDIPTARCVDWFSFEDAVTSMSLSPSGEFLATTHVEQNGIYIWANRAHFGNVLLSSDVGDEPRKITLPIPKVHTRDDRLEVMQEKELQALDTFNKAKEMEHIEKMKNSIPTLPLEIGLTTMSGLAKSKWETLPQLDVIKARNKPKEPPKAPEKAPFFLGQLEGITADGSGPSLFEHSNIAKKVGFEIDVKKKKNQLEEEDAKRNGSRLLRLGRHGAEMSLVGLLKRVKKEMTSEQASTVISYLMELSASGVDIQLNSLSFGGVEDVSGLKHLKLMLHVFEKAVESNQNFDAVQAYLHRFCVVHGDTIAQCEDLLEATNKVRQVQNKTWGKVQKLLQETSCLVKLFTKAH